LVRLAVSRENNKRVTTSRDNGDVTLQINESHLALFDNGNIAIFCAEQGIDCLITSASLTAKINNLKDTDILVVRATSADVDFTSQEIRVLTEFVRNGGSLILYGKAGEAICKVAQAFGIVFQDGLVRGPLRVSDFLRKFGAPGEIPIASKQTNGSIIGPKGSSVVLEGSDGISKAIGCKVGEGNLIAVCDDGTSFNLGAENAAQKEAVRNCYKAIITFLIPQDRHPKSTKGNVQLHKGEIISWLDDTVYVQYPRNLSSYVKPILNELPLMHRYAKEVSGTNPSFLSFGISFNPSAFFSGGSFIGLACADGYSRCAFLAS
jgi:hypothetical protein